VHMDSEAGGSDLFQGTVKTFAFRTWKEVQFHGTRTEPQSNVLSLSYSAVAMALFTNVNVRNRGRQSGT
jgi:hypothetical protein